MYPAGPPPMMIKPRVSSPPLSLQKLVGPAGPSPLLSASGRRSSLRPRRAAWNTIAAPRQREADGGDDQLGFLRELAGFRAEKGCPISFYSASTRAWRPPPATPRLACRSLLAEGEVERRRQARPDARPDGQALRADFERIRRYFDEDFDRDGARGFAVFAS